MLARRVWWVAFVGVSACFPSFDGLSGTHVESEPPADSSDSAITTTDAREESTPDAGEDIEAAPADANSEGQDGGFTLPPGAPDVGIYFYWPFESGSTKVAEDVSGNGRNGTQNNVLTSTDEAPSARLGNVRSVKLEMPQSSISCLADTPVESYTIAMWIKPVARSNVLVVSREDAASRTLLMQLRVTGTGVFEHYVNDGSSGAGCQSEVGSCIAGTTVVKGDTWYHVAVSAKSRGDMHLYVNGFEEGSSRPIMQFQSSGDRYDFGYEAGRSTGGFQGVVDEIIVYDWLLSTTDVNKLASPM